MAEEGIEPGLRRSSSQASDVSSKSGKNRTVRIRPKKSISSTTSTPVHQKDPSLTSFPSLSPEHGARSSAGKHSAQELSQPNMTISQKVRDRKATLAGLTNASPSVQGQRSLFDDSPRSSIDIPGALHLATDEHIERLIARSGALKLVRQFAKDLAYRDAEISALRIRADERERELKKMLRDADVSSQDIERKLIQLENTSTASDSFTLDTPDARPTAKRTVTSSIDDMMHEAMQEEVGDLDEEHFSIKDHEATIKPIRNDRDSGAVPTRNRAGSVKSWQDYIWRNGGTSQKTSRSSSFVSTEVQENQDDTSKTEVAPSNASRRKGLDNVFPPQAQSSATSYFIGGKKPQLPKKSTQGDEDSIASKKSEKSIASWTVRLFAGNPQAAKDDSESGNRARASSFGNAKNGRDSRSDSGTRASAAIAALSKVSSQPGSTSASKANQLTVKRGLPSSSSLSTSPDVANSDANAANLGPVEMDAILPEDTKPPTMINTYTYNQYAPSDMLTDRFGFIYDQRQRKRQREAALALKQPNRRSGIDFASKQRPATPSSIDEQQKEASSGKGWQDYLRLATRPTELLSHTPSATAIVTLTVADSTPASNTRSRASSNSSRSFPVISPLAEPTASPVTATSNDFAGSTSAPEISVTSTQQNDPEPVKLLLEQLTELHDNLQTERAVKWNEFLRKVRAERGAAAAAATDRQGGKQNLTANMPEASLVDGEFVGVTNLGTKGKIGRAKWKEFKILVLGGIPVSLRSKIWSECSGASTLRIPGYYEDLVVTSQTESDAEVAAQIQADIHRTLTDNVFFRHGPGTTKLREVLLAYAHRNPTVGYCQGMNMIVGSLLLIMPTAEDAFWILVAMIEIILPAHYYDHGLVTSRADQIVLREYVTEVLPRLSGHLEELGVELEAMTFQWFLSVFTDCLSAEALYRVWDVVLCLNSTSSATPTSPVATTTQFQNGKSAAEENNDGTGSTFLFQLALALLKLNETQLLACDNPASVYAYINHNMTNHAISIDGLIQASEGLRKVVQRDDVVEKRAKAIQGMTGGY